MYIIVAIPHYMYSWSCDLCENELMRFLCIRLTLIIYSRFKLYFVYFVHFIYMKQANYCDIILMFLQTIKAWNNLTHVFVFVLLVHCFKYYDSLDPCCPNLRRYIQTSVGTSKPPSVHLRAILFYFWFWSFIWKQKTVTNVLYLHCERIYGVIAKWYMFVPPTQTSVRKCTHIIRITDFNWRNYAYNQPA